MNASSRLVTSKGLRNALVFCALLAACATAQAQTTYTYNGGTNAWTTTTAFSPNGDPGAADTLQFTNNSTSVLSLGASGQAIKGLIVSNTFATTINSNSNTAANHVLSLGSGGITQNAGSGSFTIGNGTDDTSPSGPITLTVTSSQSWTNNSASTLTTQGAINLGANTVTLTGTGTGQTNITSGISGTGGFVINGAKVQFTGGNISSTFTGGITLNSGTLVYAGNFGSGPVYLNGGTLADTSADATGTNAFILGNNVSLPITGGGNSINFENSPITLNGSNTITGSNYFGSAFGLGTLNGNGSLSLSAPAGGSVGDSSVGATSVNTMTGSLTVTAGAESVYGSFNSATALNETGTAGITLVQSGGTINNFAVGLNGTGTFAGDNASGVVTYNGLISGTGNFHQNGAGTSVLTNAETYTGSTYAQAGTLQIGNGTSGSIVATSVLSNASGATLAFDEANGSTVTNNIGDSGTVAGVEGSGITNTLSGIISGTGGIVSQTGAGTTILTAAETYTGATTASAGTLQIGNGTSGSVAATSALSTTGTGTLAFDEATGATVASNIADGGTVGGAEGTGITNTLSGVISGAGGFNQYGAGTTILAATDTYTGPTTASAGTVQIGTGTAGSVSSSSVLSTTGGATGGTLAFNEVNGTTVASNIADNGAAVGGAENSGNTNTLSGVISGTGGFNQYGAGTTVLTGADTYTGPTTVSNGTLIVGNGTAGSINGASAIGVGAGTGNGTLVFDEATGSIITNTIDDENIVSGGEGSGATNTLSGVISGAGSFSQIAAGTTILNATDTYTGGTSVQAGTLQIGDGTSGSIANTSMAIVSSGATLAFDQANGSSFGSSSQYLIDSGTVTGVEGAGITNTIASPIVNGTVPGSVTQTGGGTTILTGADSYTGATTASAGILQIGNGTSGVVSASSALSTTGTGSLAFDEANGNTISNAIANNGAAVVGAEGTGITNTLSGVISGAKGFTQSGPGTTVLSGVNTYSGVTAVNSGKLRVTGSTGAGSTVTVGNNTSAAAILSGTGVVGGSVTTSSTGTDIAYLAPGSNTTGARSDFGNAGTLTIGGSLTIGAGTNLDYDLGATSTPGAGVNDLIAATGGLNLGTSTTFNFMGPLATGMTYTLITSSGITGFNPADFVTTGDAGLVATYSEVGTSLDVTFSAIVMGAYFNGLGNDLNTAGDYDTSATSNTPDTAVPTGTTNVSFGANRNTSSTPNISAPLTVNSIAFGAGTAGVQSGITVSSSAPVDTLTIMASNANGNTAGNGITINAGGGSDTISASIVLGSSQTFTTTDATSNLTVSGPISDGGHAYTLTKAGAGSLTLTKANTYSGGTVAAAGTLYINGGTAGSSSGSGSGTITVATGARLGGSGVIRPAANGIILAANSTLISGGVQTGATAGKGITLDNTGSVANSTILNASIGSADLTFSLGAGTVSSTPAYNFANPNTNSTYMTVMGNTANELKFATGDMITVNDLTGNNSLQLNMSVPYLLISAGSDADYSGLITSGGVSVSGVTQNGFVTNLTVNGTAATENYGTRLYLYNGDLEVVPEPSTWAMMIGGLAVLVFWQRRKNKLS
jgi:fibronectin-binding autotransporter adhesin